MLYFNNLNRLQTHTDYLADILQGQQFFFVWGLIRDLLLNRETNLEDADITLGWKPSDIKQLIKQSDKDFSYFDTEKYGTMTVIPSSPSVPLPPSSGEGWWQDIATLEKSKVQYEITPFRTETTYSDGRHPDEVSWSDSLLEDSKRRDFSINCLYYTQLRVNKPNKSQTILDTHDLQTNEKSLVDNLLVHLEKQWYYLDEYSSTLILQDHDLIQQFQDWGLDEILLENIVHVIVDPQLWIQNLFDKKITAVGNADIRFQEDALRLIRALRFAIALECDIDTETRTALQKNAYLIRNIAKERIKTELDKVFSGNNPFGFVSLLDSANMLKWIFPKLYDNKRVEQPIRYHPFDVYTHSMLVLYHLQALSKDRLLRYAALYHDVGKVEQYSSYLMKLDEQGIRDMFWSWLNHTISGAEFTEIDYKALGMSNAEVETIARYVAHHMKPGEIARWSAMHYKKKIRKLIAEVGPERTKGLLILTMADVYGQYNPLQSPDISTLEHLVDLVDEIIEDEGRFHMSDMVVNGTILMEKLKINPGPELWHLLKRAYERVLEDPTRNDKQTLLHQIKQRLHHS